MVYFILNNYVVRRIFAFTRSLYLVLVNAINIVQS